MAEPVRFKNCLRMGHGRRFVWRTTQDYPLSVDELNELQAARDLEKAADETAYYRAEQYGYGDPEIMQNIGHEMAGVREKLKDVLPGVIDQNVDELLDTDKTEPLEKVRETGWRRFIPGKGIFRSLRTLLNPKHKNDKQRSRDATWGGLDKRFDLAARAFVTLTFPRRLPQRQLNRIADVLNVPAADLNAEHLAEADTDDLQLLTNEPFLQNNTDFIRLIEFIRVHNKREPGSRTMYRRYELATRIIPALDELTGEQKRIVSAVLGAPFEELRLSHLAEASPGNLQRLEFLQDNPDFRKLVNVIKKHNTAIDNYFSAVTHKEERLNGVLEAYKAPKETLAERFFRNLSKGQQILYQFILEQVNSGGNYATPVERLVDLNGMQIEDVKARVRSNRVTNNNTQRRVLLRTIWNSLDNNERNIIQRAIISSGLTTRRRSPTRTLLSANDAQIRNLVAAIQPNLDSSVIQLVFGPLSRTLFPSLSSYLNLNSFDQVTNNFESGKMATAMNKLLHTGSLDSMKNQDVQVLVAELERDVSTDGADAVLTRLNNIYGEQEPVETVTPEAKEKPEEAKLKEGEKPGEDDKAKKPEERIEAKKLEETKKAEEADKASKNKEIITHLRKLTKTRDVLYSNYTLAPNIGGRIYDLREQIHGLREQINSLTSGGGPKGAARDIMAISGNLSRQVEGLRSELKPLQEQQQTISQSVQDNEQAYRDQAKDLLRLLNIYEEDTLPDGTDTNLVTFHSAHKRGINMRDSTTDEIFGPSFFAGGTYASPAADSSPFKIHITTFNSEVLNQDLYQVERKTMSPLQLLFRLKVEKLKKLKADGLLDIDDETIAERAAAQVLHALAKARNIDLNWASNNELAEELGASFLQRLKRSIGVRRGEGEVYSKEDAISGATRNGSGLEMFRNVTTNTSETEIIHLINETVRASDEMTQESATNKLGLFIVALTNSVVGYYPEGADEKVKVTGKDAVLLKQLIEKLDKVYSVRKPRGAQFRDIPALPGVSMAQRVMVNIPELAKVATEEERGLIAGAKNILKWLSNKAWRKDVKDVIQNTIAKGGDKKAALGALTEKGIVDAGSMVATAYALNGISKNARGLAGWVGNGLAGAGSGLGSLLLRGTTATGRFLYSLPGRGYRRTRGTLGWGWNKLKGFGRWLTS
jgi:hypothetical protein